MSTVSTSVEFSLNLTLARSLSISKDSTGGNNNNNNSNVVIVIIAIVLVTTVIILRRRIMGAFISICSTQFKAPQTCCQWRETTANFTSTTKRNKTDNPKEKITHALCV